MNRPFKESTKLADIIYSNYSLVPIIQRFDINLGFGNDSVKKVCEAHNVNINFFLEILNVYQYNDYFPKKELQNYPVSLCIEYLIKNHKYYLNKKIPDIETDIENLILHNDKQKNNLKLFENFLQEYKQELINHIELEEEKIYPYAIKIEEHYNKTEINKDIIEQIKKYRISNFLNEHSDIEGKLYDMKNLIIRYLPPLEPSTIYNRILFDFFRLESDIYKHNRIEEKVMIPVVSRLEDKLLSLWQAREV